MTQEQLAERSSLSVRSIGNLEAGRTRPRFDTVRLLGKALDLTAQEYDRLVRAIGDQTSRLAVGPAVPYQLPPAATPFSGRAAELADSTG